ncbi:unnamed protein product [Ectocarpus sp. 8 AP-2014]
MKRLWKHIAECKNQQCPIPHCVSSRFVLSHYHRCKDLKCAVCAPVREVIAKSHQRQMVTQARNRVAGSGQPGAGGISGQQLAGSSGHMVGPNGVAGRSGGGSFSNQLAQRQQLETQRGLMTPQQAAQARQQQQNQLKVSMSGQQAPGFHQGKHIEAIPLLERASSIRRKSLGEGHHSTVDTQITPERVRKHVREETIHCTSRKPGTQENASFCAVTGRVSTRSKGAACDSAHFKNSTKNRGKLLCYRT